jgi:D-arabinose 1-dehydrogenase-like Zn-dependent alcohol dehydrogenase
MEQKIGVCSICGGDVVAWRGPWHAVIPPSAPHCTNCGAVEAASEPVIPMKRSGARRIGRVCPAPPYPFKWFREVLR